MAEIEESNKLSKEKRNFWIIVLLGFVVLVIFSFYNQYKIDLYRNTFKGDAIGLTTRFKKESKHLYLQYCFYVNGKIISFKRSSRNEGLLNKFYLVKYDLKNPEASYIVLDKELKPDSLTLVKAGFTNVKYYIYDGGKTCEYIEKTKWK